MKKSCVSLTVLFFVNSILGTDGIEVLKKYVDAFTITSANLVVTNHSTRTQIVWEDGPTPTSFRKASFHKEPYEEELILTPDKESSIGRGNSRITFKPVSFKNQRKGFRIVREVMYSLDQDYLEVTYLVLSDTPMTLGEDDVEMVLDNGEWVKSEESRSLAIEKMNRETRDLIRDAGRIIQDPEWLAIVLRNPESVKKWNGLVDRGFIKGPTLTPLPVIPPKEEPTERRDASHTPDAIETPNHAVEDEQSERLGETPSPYRLWLGVGIFLCACCASLFFLRRKFSDH